MQFEALIKQQPSVKKRITVTIDEGTYSYVEKTAAENSSSVAAAAAELLRYGCRCAAEMDRRSAEKRQAEAQQRMRSQYSPQQGQ